MIGVRGKKFSRLFGKVNQDCSGFENHEIVVVAIDNHRNAAVGIERQEVVLESGFVESYVRENIDPCLVILKDGLIAGFGVGRGDLVDLMIIDADLHRQGLGSILLAALEAKLGRDHDLLRLESFAENAPANRFYEKHGWREIGRALDGESGQMKVTFTKRTR